MQKRRVLEGRDSRNDQIRLLSIVHQQAQRLNRLSHSHLIGKHAAAPFSFLLLSHPSHTLQLEREKFDLLSRNQSPCDSPDLADVLSSPLAELLVPA